jgi:hypothetical protein
MLLEDPWSYYAGCTPEANHELMLRAYIKKYGISGEDLEKLYIALAQISVKNHLNATKNEYAQYQRKITVEQVLKARKKRGDLWGFMILRQFLMAPQHNSHKRGLRQKIHRQASLRSWLCFSNRLPNFPS